MTTGLPDGTRLVVQAGDPSAEEVAALALAIDAAVRARRPQPVQRRSAWVAAARREGVGKVSAATRSDVRGWG